MNEEMIRALNANTAAMHEHTDALREHTAALHAQADQTEKLRRFLERITEDYQTGGHIGVKEATDRLGRIAKMMVEASENMDRAAKRMLDSRR